MVKNMEYVVLYTSEMPDGIIYAGHYRTPSFSRACAFIKRCLSEGWSVYSVNKEITERK